MRRSSVFYAVGAFIVLLALITGAALFLTTHKRGPVAVVAGSDTPEESVQQSVALIKAGDFAGFWKHALPPADYDTLRADWKLPRPDQPQQTPEERADFVKNMQQLTEPDAETKLYAVAKPKLAQLKAQYSDQLPVMIGIFQAIAATGVSQSKELTNPQKQQATEVINVLAPWAQTVPWFDQDRARQAIAVAVTTARKLDLKTPEQLRGMDFDTAMAKYSDGFLGAKRILAIYGLTLDETFDSVKVSTTESRNGHAHVHIDYTLLGKPLSMDSDLVQQDGRWYSDDVLQNVREAHERLLHPASPASTAGAAPASTVSIVHANAVATPGEPAQAKATPAKASTTGAPARH